MLDIVVLGLTVLLNFLIGLVVFLKNPKGMTNRFFFMLTNTLVVWSLVNYLSVHPLFFSQLVWIRLVLFCGALLNLAVYLTFITFPSSQFPAQYRKRVKVAVWYTAFVMLLTLTPLVFHGLKVSEGTASPVPGPGIALFGLQTLLLIGSGLWALVAKYLASSGITRVQLLLALVAVASTFGLIVISNFLFVVIFDITMLVPFGPAFTLIFTLGFAYTIIKHRLFDIRAAIARSVGYVLSLGFIGLLYGVAAYGLVSILGPSELSANGERAVYIGLALVTAFAYPYTKQFFERITTKLFFKNAYDPQIFLNELNDVLVEKVELEPLLGSSAQILSSNLKAAHVTFVIRQTAYFPSRMIGDKLSISEAEHEALRDRTIHVPGKVIVADNLEDEHTSLRNLLRSKDIAVLARLVPNLDYPIEGVGFLALGPKRNGEPYNSKDEEILEIIANELVIAIENGLRFEEIDKFSSTLQDKIDVATRQLKRTNDKLKALDETKDEFISMASHQLRTPLTSVKGYLSMVIEGDAGEINDMQRKLLEQAFTSSQRMVYLIADLLNLSRLRTGKFVIENTPTNLAKVVTGELDQLRESLAAKDMKLTYDEPKDFPTLLMDETKIRQVLMNFIDNAIYYTPAGGKIEVALKETKDSIEFTVKDNGMGVPKDEQHHLFNKFYRAGNARKARPDGTGLGLFMAKKVVVAQGGAIIFDSKEGKGSTFGFMFAKKRLALPEKAPVAELATTEV